MRHHVERVHEAAVVEHAVVHVVGGGVALVAAESQGHGGTLRAAQRRLRAHPAGAGGGCPAAAQPAPGGGRRAAPARPCPHGPARPGSAPPPSPLLAWEGSEDAGFHLRAFPSGLSPQARCLSGQSPRRVGAASERALPQG